MGSERIRSLCRIGGVAVIPARERGVRTFRVFQEQGGEEDTDRWETAISFGPYGIGSSVPAVAGQYHDSSDIETEVWGYLGPGMRWTKLGLALDNPITFIRSAAESEVTGGPNFAGSAANSTGIGTVAWQNPGNATASDNVYATAALNNQTTNYLLCTSFGFSLPTDAVVLGIRVLVEGKVSDASGGTVNARIVRGGVIQTGVTRQASLTSTSDTTISLGGVADLWGLPWTAADINASNFGVAVYFFTASNLTVSIDAVQIEITFLTGNRYLYVGSGTQLHKLRLQTDGGALFGVVETKTFSFPPTDLVVVREPGEVALLGGTRLGWNQTGDGYILIGFGAVAGLEQIDRIGRNTADTYRNGAKTAYAAVFGSGQAADNTQVLLWKSTAQVPQTTGAFSALQSAAIAASSVDYTNASNWTPVTPYRIGNPGSSITAIVEYGGAIHVAKPEGVFSFNSQYAPYPVFSTERDRHAQNGFGMVAWGTMLIIPIRSDLAALPTRGANPTVGITTLVANHSPNQGTPVATAVFGDTLYVAYYDGSSSYILAMRERVREPVPHPMLFYPVTRFTSYRITALATARRGDGTIDLWASVPSDTAGKHDIAYAVIAPAASRRYATGGFWESTTFGSLHRHTRVEEIIVYAEGVDASNYFDIALQWDNQPATTVGRVNKVGRNVITLTPGVGDNGFVGRVRITATVASPTARPRLRAASWREGDGGIILRGTRQAEVVDMFELTIVAAPRQADGMGGFTHTTPARLYDTLSAMRGEAVALVYEDWFGDRTPRMAVIRTVGFVSGPQDSPEFSQRLIAIRGRLLSGKDLIRETP